MTSSQRSGFFRYEWTSAGANPGFQFLEAGFAPHRESAIRQACIAPTPQERAWSFHIVESGPDSFGTLKEYGLPPDSRFRVFGAEIGNFSSLNEAVHTTLVRLREHYFDIPSDAVDAIDRALSSGQVRSEVSYADRLSSGEGIASALATFEATHSGIPLFARTGCQLLLADGTSQLTLPAMSDLDSSALRLVSVLQGDPAQGDIVRGVSNWSEFFSAVHLVERNLGEWQASLTNSPHALQLQLYSAQLCRRTLEALSVKAAPTELLNSGLSTLESRDWAQVLDNLAEMTGENPKLVTAAMSIVATAPKQLTQHAGPQLEAVYLLENDQVPRLPPTEFKLSNHVLVPDNPRIKAYLALAGSRYDGKVDRQSAIAALQTMISGDDAWVTPQMVGRMLESAELGIDPFVFAVANNLSEELAMALWRPAKGTYLDQRRAFAAEVLSVLGSDPHREVVAEVIPPLNLAGRARRRLVLRRLRKLVGSR